MNRKNVCSLSLLFLSVLFFSQTTTFSAIDESGLRNLFNGRDLAGWEGNPAFWSVKNGVITGRTTTENPAKENTFLVWKEGSVDDFELRLSYKITPDNKVGFANSGIQYRSKVVDPGNWVVGGYQADIEAGKTYTGILYEERGRGILAKRGQRTVIKEVNGKTKVDVVGEVGKSDEIQAGIKTDDWNEYVIIAKGNHLTHSINGKTTVDVIDEQETKAAKSGVLALQLHAGEPMTVQFKDIRLKSAKSMEQTAATSTTATNATTDGKKKIMMVAGTPSHAPGDHEFNAGVLLLKKCFDQVPGVVATAHLNGWPKDPRAFDGADTIMFFMDGGKNHPIIQDDHLKIVGDLMKKGIGLVVVHYAVEVPKDKGGPEFLEWLGGYYEDRFSTNPHWVADVKSLPNHPITRGVKPFAVEDEWYFNMRFLPETKGIIPILVAKPSDETRLGKSASPRGPYPHIVAASGRDEVLAWAVERPDGGRGFGFTGAHNHENWGNADFRRLMLNALMWTAKAEVPTGGVSSAISEEDLKKNLDPKTRK